VASLLVVGLTGFLGLQRLAIIEWRVQLQLAAAQAGYLLPAWRAVAEQEKPGAMWPPGVSFRGGGGNRTRVLQCINRASPGAACFVFLSPGIHAGKMPTGSVTV